MKLINNHRQPITLDSGLILAAAGTNGSVREVDSITDRDRRRYVQPGRIAVIESEAPAAPVQEVVAAEAPSAPALVSETEMATVPARKSDKRKESHQ